ncbi:MAG: hypothetical protein PHC82_01335, partial [Candidatus Pacebacteria bacterium]|nr:hypothetical protein [Candidatus Paceibacterota bacterium]
TISPIITEGDIKPGETKESVVVNLTNSGNNDGLADLHVTSAVAGEGVDSEPECVAESKTWGGSSPCTGSETLNENICSQITLNYTYDANGNGVKDAGESGTLGTLASLGSLNLDVLPTGVTRKVWLDYTLDSAANNEFQGDVCTFAVDFTLKQLGVPGDGVYSFIDIGNPLSEFPKNIKGWSHNIWPQGGGWGGGDDQTIRTVASTLDDVESPLPAGQDDSATVVMDFGSVSATKKIYIRHLDGQTDDSFKVYVDGTLIDSYTDAYSTETWLTSSFDVSSYTGTHEVKITLTASHWESFDSYGQLGISWIKIAD